MALPIDSSTYSTLSAMITPAIFMTANGSLIISTSNRMSRVVDRIRVLNDLGDQLCRGAVQSDFVAERRAHVSDQLDRLERRSDLVRYALTLLYLSFSCFVGTSLTLAVHTHFTRNFVAGVATGLSVFGVCSMLTASVNLMREATAALKSNRLEIRFFRDLQQLRDTQGTCSVK